MPVFQENLSAMHIGPTVDSAAEQARPLIREEPFQLQATRAPGVSLTLKPRPEARSGLPLSGMGFGQIQAQRITVSARQGNGNPANAGADDVTSAWSVSDPGQLAFLADEQAKTPMGFIKPLLIGLALGWVGLKLARR